MEIALSVERGLSVTVAAKTWVLVIRPDEYSD